MLHSCSNRVKITVTLIVATTRAPYWGESQTRIVGAIHSRGCFLDTTSPPMLSVRLCYPFPLDRPPDITRVSSYAWQTGSLPCEAVGACTWRVPRPLLPPCRYLTSRCHPCRPVMSGLTCHWLSDTLVDHNKHQTLNHWIHNTATTHKSTKLN